MTTETHTPCSSEPLTDLDALAMYNSGLLGRLLVLGGDSGGDLSAIIRKTLRAALDKKSAGEDRDREDDFGAATPLGFNLFYLSTQLHNFSPVEYHDMSPDVYDLAYAWMGDTTLDDIVAKAAAVTKESPRRGLVFARSERRYLVPC